MGKMKELFIDMMNKGLIQEGQLPEFYKPAEEEIRGNCYESEGYWIQVSPMSKLNSWIAAVYVRGKSSWVTETCQSGFSTPDEAYEWGHTEIQALKNIKYAKTIQTKQEENKGSK